MHLERARCSPAFSPRAGKTPQDRPVAAGRRRRLCSGSRFRRKLDHGEALQRPLTACMNPSTTKKTTAATEFPLSMARAEIARLVSSQATKESSALPFRPEAQETATSAPKLRIPRKEGRWSVALYFVLDTHKKQHVNPVAVFAAHSTHEAWLYCFAGPRRQPGEDLPAAGDLATDELRVGGELRARLVRVESEPELFGSEPDRRER